MANDSPARKIYGLIGYPVKHSLSPAMHNAAFHALNIDAEYRLFEVKPDQLKDFLINNIEIQDTKGESFFSQDIVGFNITIPHKVKAREILEKKFHRNFEQHNDTDEQSCFWFVELTNAVNTVKREKRGLHYFNTDALGFLKSLLQELKSNLNYNSNILIVGFGGAGRAVLAGLSLQHAFIKKIYIADIDKNANASLQRLLAKSTYTAGQVQFISIEEIPDKIKECNLLINASPIGMKEDDGSVIDKNLLHRNLSVYDVVYNRETQLIKDAKSLKLTAVGGLGMLLYQGVLAFKLWIGKEAPVEVMREALLKAL